MFNSSLKQIIVEKIKEENITSTELSKKLEYVKIVVGANRIDEILNSNLLRIGSGGYDYRYITSEILEALCEILNIEKAVYIDGIKEIRNELKRIETRYHANIKIFSEYKPKPSSYASAIGISKAINIKLPRDFVDKPFDLQKVEVLQKCRQHYSENKGSLGKIFGLIKFYRYFYSKDKYIDLEIIDGQIT
ncbi:MAG: hypothetical protein PF574_06880 [Candidatus Delongbacteria bacterium]|jgi:hypothetical protein|nr:hypothetical protein [Candidatus Delongbacteria bacterium]